MKSFLSGNICLTLVTFKKMRLIKKLLEKLKMDLVELL